jgi:hypothetical protein
MGKSIPDINSDRDSSLVSTEEAKRRSESQGRPQGESESDIRHGGAGKMGMDRTTAEEQRNRATGEAKNRDQSQWPNDDGDLEKSSGHP